MDRQREHQGQRAEGADLDQEVGQLGSSLLEIRLGRDDEDPALPVRKVDGAWKLDGFPSGVTFRSPEEAECISGGMQEFDAGGAQPFWRREGREDFRDYIVAVCRRAIRRGVLEASGNEPELQRICREVILEMVRSGQIRDPSDG